MTLLSEAHQQENEHRTRKKVIRYIRACEGITRSHPTRQDLLAMGLGFRKPADSELKLAYETLTSTLNRQFRLESRRTPAEIRVYHLFKNLSNRTIHRSVWIGNRNVDLFMPGIKRQCGTKGTMQGLAIEINGSIHNTVGKMRKDTHLADYLAILKLAVATFENKEIFSETGHKRIQELTRLPTLDHRGRKRVWRRIWADTIALKGNLETISNLYGQADIARLENLTL